MTKVKQRSIKQINFHLVRYIISAKTMMIQYYDVLKKIIESLKKMN